MIGTLISMTQRERGLQMILEYMLMQWITRTFKTPIDNCEALEIKENLWILQSIEKSGCVELYTELDETPWLVKSLHR